MEYTILVNSCDAYADLWEPFFTLLKKYWAAPIPKIVLNTETKSFSMDGLEIFCPHCPDNPQRYYGKRLKYVLSQIETDYVLCLLDDFFFREAIDVEMIQNLVGYMEENKNICCFNFENAFEGKNSDRYPGFVSLPPIAEYRLNMQAAVWRTADLDSFWKDKVNPWTWETISNKLTYNTNREFYFLHKDCKVPINYGKRPGLTWGVVRGKWFEDDVVPLFKKEGLAMDFSARGFFENGSVKSPTYKKMLEINLEYLYILGPAFMLKNFCYSTIYRRIKALFGQTVIDYDSYLAQKYNGNGRK